MKLLRDAAFYQSDIDAERRLIFNIESRLGSLEISAGVIPDGQPAFFGWWVAPEDRSLVLVMNGYNWGPGAGPRPTLRECLESIASELDNSLAVIHGKPGIHGVHVPKPDLSELTAHPETRARVASTTQPQKDFS